MAAIFVVDRTIPEAWQDAPGGLDGPLVLVGAYLLVRCVHRTLSVVAAADDHELRHQLAIAWGPLLGSAALLVAGALVGGTQTLLFAGALLVDGVGVWLTSRQGGWRLPAPGTGPNDTGTSSSWPSVSRWSPSGWAPPSRPSAGRCWWRPFWAWPRPSACGGCTSTWRRWRPSTGWPRRMAGPGSGWLWRPTPMGTSPLLPASCSPPWHGGVLAHAEDTKPLGGFYGAARFGGVTLYLAGYLLFKQRTHSKLGLPPLAGLAALVLILAALIVVETTRYAQIRRSLRGA